MKESRSWISLKKAPMSKLEAKVLTKALRKEGFFLVLGRALSRTSSSPEIFGSTAVVWGLFMNKQQWVGMVPGFRRPRASLGWSGRRRMGKEEAARAGVKVGEGAVAALSWLSELEVGNRQHHSPDDSLQVLTEERRENHVPSSVVSSCLPELASVRDTESGEIRGAEQGAGKHGMGNRDRVHLAAGGPIGFSRGPKAGKLQCWYLSPVPSPPRARIPVALG